MNQTADLEIMRDALMRLCGALTIEDKHRRHSVAGQIKADLKRLAAPQDAPPLAGSAPARDNK